MKRTTLCYISSGEKLLMLHRNKKKNDENAEKYIGLGGHFEDGETPEECMLREIYEESGFTLTEYRYRGIVYFHSDIYDDEEMHLFTATVSPLEIIPDCPEGTLALVTKEKLFSLKMWEGDRIFLNLLFENSDFFKLSLRYQGESLTEAILNGRSLEDKNRP